MSNNDGNDKKWITIAIAIIVVIAILGYIFSTLLSTLLDIDMSSAALVFKNLIGWLTLTVVLIGAFLKLEIRLRNIVPFLLAVLWACGWPALNFWGSKNSFSFSEVSTIWWDEWYTKWGVFFAIWGLGYLIKKIWLDD